MGIDQETAARLAEADLITEDLERANSRVAEVERRNEKLRAEIEAVRSGSESAAQYVYPIPAISRFVLTTNCRVSLMETQISDLQTEASRLIRSLESQKDASDLASKEVRKKVDELVRERDGVSKDLETLRHKIALYADYDEIKRELEIMKVRPLRPSSQFSLLTRWNDSTSNSQGWTSIKYPEIPLPTS